MNRSLTLAFLLVSLAAQSQTDTAYLKVDQYPTYVGGDEAFYADVADQLSVQLIENEKRHIAKHSPYAVIAAFVVNQHGQVDSVWIDHRSDDFLISDVMEKIIYGLGNWKPGIKDGEPVSTIVYVQMDLRVYNDIVSIPYHPIYPDSEILGLQNTQKGISPWAIVAAVLTVGIFALIIGL